MDTSPHEHHTNQQQSSKISTYFLNAQSESDKIVSQMNGTSSISTPKPVFPSKEQLDKLLQQEKDAKPDLVHFSDGLECKEWDKMENLPEKMREEIMEVLKINGIEVDEGNGMDVE